MRAHDPWLILAVFLFVLCPFGLPFLWRGLRFSTFSKVVLSGLFLVYVAAFLWLMEKLVRELFGSSIR